MITYYRTNENLGLVCLYEIVIITDIRGVRVGGALVKTEKGGHLMSLSYSANRDKTFWSSLGRR